MISPAGQSVVERLTGTLVPAVLTPLGSDGGLAQSALDRYAAKVTSADIGGVAVWAHSGRGPFLGAPERRRILATFRQRCAGVIIAGVGSATSGALEPTLRQAETAVEGGADALLVFPPPDDGSDRAEATRVLHRALADRFGVPLILFYLYAAAGGYGYPPELLRELLSIPAVAGIKLATLDDAITCQDVTRLVREEFPDRIVLTGEDRMFGPSLMWGADAALVGIAGAVTEASTSVLAAWRHGAAQEFLDRSHRLDRFAAATFHAPMDGYVQRMLWVAQWEGLISADAAHDPFGPALPPSDRRRVRAAYDGLAPLN